MSFKIFIQFAQTDCMCYDIKYMGGNMWEDILYFLSDYSVVGVKLITAFVVVLVFLKLFGMKGQLKQMTSLDLIINFILSAILSGFILNDNLGLAGFFVVMGIYVGLVYIVLLVTRKTNWGRRLLIGTPKVIIENGKLNTDLINKTGISIHDIAAAMRLQDIRSLSEVKMAQIEPGGDLTIVRAGDTRYPIIIIDNGVLDKDALESINKDEKWLKRHMRAKKIKEMEDVMAAYWYKSHLEFVRK